MDTNNDTTVSRKNKHLNLCERAQIELLRRDGLTAYAIGKRLGRPQNTIKNEIDRGTVTQIKNGQEIEIYYAKTGQLVYQKNRKNCGTKYKLSSVLDFLQYVEDAFFNKGHSLDAISGRAKKEGLFRPEQMLCTKSLYKMSTLAC